MTAFLAGFLLAALLIGLVALRLWLDQRDRYARMHRELDQHKRNACAQRQHEARQYVSYYRLPDAPRSPLRDPRSMSPN